MPNQNAVEAIRCLSNAWPLPSNPRPIVILGAGAIVNDAHLPAYREAGLPVAGIFDIDPARSKATAERFQIASVFDSIGQAVSLPDAAFDIAVPPERAFAVLEQLPPRSVLLLQKPMGCDLDDARRIRQLCRERGHRAAVNFQLRFSPVMLAIRDALRRDLLGDVLNLEIVLHTWTPWDLFPFMKRIPRTEILLHSIHYLDWIRALLGEPKGVYARTLGHPRFPEVKSTRTAAILDYGDRVRCCLSIDHNFAFGPKHQSGAIRVEGTRGAAVASLGVLLNYPRGEPDRLEIVTEGTDWTEVPLEGDWFPDAFRGPMSNLQRFAAGEDSILLTGVEGAYRTMALVEACYRSNAAGGTPIPE
ncbi:MAG: Gfo/Idh/MocA family oxidoreductase [Pirellulales bacterium]|nr:Gfo/Idh/MocA family oxidoreductase [Pirellulales bacterium]